ncbi:MAG: hypothetical protein BA863_07525 [Desulfovibrio sp. S3730MH75]|nr:MAG: hypothetical protein BA863_07525 [Desulfovibrio sp. S3730MH75]
MKLRTLDKLFDSLAREITWRKRELVNFLSIVNDNTSPRYIKNALYRSGVTLLYAHWEGFVKQACTNYLCFVCMQRVKNKDLSVNLQSLIFHETLKKYGKTKKASLYHDAINFLSIKGEHQSIIPYKGIINTQSNLNSEVFKEIAWLTQMDYSLFQTSEHFIDSFLLAKRNHIAHGEACPIDKSSYLMTHDKVIELLEMVKTQLENNALSGIYKN